MRIDPHHRHAKRRIGFRLGQALRLAERHGQRDLRLGCVPHPHQTQAPDFQQPGESSRGAGGSIFNIDAVIGHQCKAMSEKTQYQI